MLLRNLFTALLVAVSINGARAAPRWLNLLPTPTLPKATQSGFAPVNGIRVWYAVFGRGEPVLLLHGGLANANYWGHQVRALQRHYQVIVMESRGHGRSSRNQEPYGYDLMASDVVGLLDHLKIRKAAIVGWSDGAIIGLDIAMKHPERVTKLFAFAANSGSIWRCGYCDKRRLQRLHRAGPERSTSASRRRRTEYKTFVAEITRMWESQPKWSASDLAAIKVPTWIVDGDHDEAIKRENTEFMAASIPGAGLLIQPQVSHFSFLQDPSSSPTTCCVSCAWRGEGRSRGEIRGVSASQGDDRIRAEILDASLRSLTGSTARLRSSRRTPEVRLLATLESDANSSRPHPSARHATRSVHAHTSSGNGFAVARG